MERGIRNEIAWGGNVARQPVLQDLQEYLASMAARINKSSPWGTVDTRYCAEIRILPRCGHQNFITVAKFNKKEFDVEIELYAVYVV
jgi:hypothetical protein